MSRYNHLSIEERESLAIKLAKGQSLRGIAQELHRAPSTISREMKRNDPGKGYSPHRAQNHYEEAREKSVRRSILRNPQAVSKVTELLSRFWSPEQISNRLKYENNKMRISTSTIYRGIQSGLLDESCRNKLRIKSKRYRKNKQTSRCGHLNVEYRIADRPKSIKHRKRFGHWESDTICGANNDERMATHVERRSRYLLLLSLPSGKATAFAQATIEAFQSIPPRLRKSFTVDHGKEFAKHRDMMQALDCKIYFADPHCPNQRATNENTNGLLRQFFPKGIPFGDQDLAVHQVAHLYNTRPRKCLGWKSPAEVFFHKSLHFT